MIDVDDLHLAFGEAEVLRGVSLSVEPGELVGLIGPNGAGKTTLLHTINGLLSPNSGTVTLDGTPVSELSSKAASRRVATVPQDTHVNFAFTAEQLIEMGRTPHRSRLDWDDDAEPVERALERTDTTSLRDRTVDNLSGGERQRVLLARALAQEAPALVLDEPTASLDVNHQVRVLELVRGLIDHDRAVLAAIHDLDLAARYCDRLALLADGQIAVEGTPADVLGDERLAAAFDTSTVVSQNPVTGTPQVTAMDAEASTRERVHIVGSGEPAAAAVGACCRAGYDVSLGVVPAGDVAAATARDLGARTVESQPFAEPDRETVDRACERVRTASIVVVADGPMPGRVEEAVATHDAVIDARSEAETAAPLAEVSRVAPGAGGGPASTAAPAIASAVADLARPPAPADD